ncbi:hypothetical protein LTR84_009444 [Exophiala bonariae]|uniref:DUF7892 domain-containing protein n=1 Tax=Exophiala bonariae TaxID=1690606 RepID=A0AAV9MV46_9EURO|nr:hypothetical protein LTR84_009444 [Exophiala bonariae]
MASSSSGSVPMDEAEWQNGVEPLMRVEKQLRNLEGSSYQVIPTGLPAPRKVTFHIDKLSYRIPPKPSDDAIHAGFRGFSPLPPLITNHSFLINTVESMQNGEQPTSDEPPTNPTPTGNDKLPNTASQDILGETQLPRKRALRSSRPLKISDKVNSDIWQTILGYCEPRLLLAAKTINKEFRQLLSDRTAIWRTSRQNAFGYDMPDCPVDMSEQAYADLLVGRGCQNRNCPKEQTAGVYWTFQVRLCADCFKKKTMRADELPVHRRHVLNITAEGEGRPLWELLPLARSDGRRHMRPRSVDMSTNGWASAHSHRQYVFLRSAYLRLENKYLLFLRSEPSSAQLATWTDGILTKTLEFMVEVNQLETWHKVQKRPDTNVHNARERFFVARAAELSPPIKRSVLLRMAAFRRILNVQTPPTERSWKTLEAKIMPYRIQAEVVEQFELDMTKASADRFSQSILSSPTPPAIKLYRVLHEYRSGHKSKIRGLKPEQEFVLELGKKEFKRCLDNKVADADIVLLCLKNVFDRYCSLSEVPNGMNYDGSIGRYRLSLDDARMIVQEVMEKQIPRNSPRGGKVFQNLRCRGCRRTDFVRSWSFVDAFEHILHVHAKVVGQGLEFWQFAVPYARDVDQRFTEQDRASASTGFPWYLVAWPRCLPLVPSHQDPWTLDNWHPAISVPYVEKPPAVTVSAFENRVPHATELAENDFVGNLLHAARTLNGIWLEGECQFKIALKYAIDLYLRAEGSEPPLSSFATCLNTLHDANPSIELRFRCNVCVGEETVYRTARQVKYKIDLEALLAHWGEKHANSNSSWSQNLMLLPSAAEVWQQILEADEKLLQERQATRERTQQLSGNVRKRPKLKGNLVMNARSAGEVFDQLFGRVTVAGCQVGTAMDKDEVA